MSLHNALQATKVRSEESELHIYKGKVSKDWCIGGIPHGGYVVGIVLTAAGDLQSSSPHPDPVHLTAHYLQSVEVSECEVRLKIIRRGKNFTNIDTDLIQKGKTKIAARLIYGVLPDLTQLSSLASPGNLTLTPTSPYGRRIPLSTHPSQAIPDEPHIKFLYQIKAEDPFFAEQNARRAKRQSANSGDLRPSEIPDCGVESGSWFELKDPNVVMEIAMIPLFADCIMNLPLLLPNEMNSGPMWFATVVLTVEFKSRIPTSISTPDAQHSPFSPRTVGIYASSRFMTEGRHDEYVEVWTAPSIIGSCSPVDPTWRDKQVCLAISTQMALTIPWENSPRKGRL
ncbi:hypothetical protein ACEPAF_7224 [Sanghuangporus sanghuang]